ncbi:cystatin-C [Sceloporus undulatus]|uniref:cystatin-C n=1 Tax=Sceloporus undulatus TaxID=8520 RepID=UPI001C4BB5E9|nr:cystatin-C [Sceloporus undulatus]
MGLSGWLCLWAAVVVGAVAGAGAERIVGAPVEVSANEEGVQQALRFAMNQYNSASNDMYGSRVAQVLSVKKQIVAGIKYIITAKVGRTTCTKSAASLENCAFHEAPELAKHVTCNFEVYSVPWLNRISLLKNNCE